MIAQVREKGLGFGELKQVTKDAREVVVRADGVSYATSRNPRSILVIATDISRRRNSNNNSCAHSVLRALARWPADWRTI